MVMPSRLLLAMSVTVCQMQNSSRTTKIQNIPMTTCILCSGESASSLTLMPPAILSFSLTTSRFISSLS